jgi:hypothetical protein
MGESGLLRKKKLQNTLQLSGEIESRSVNGVRGIAPVNTRRVRRRWRSGWETGLDG